jgi:hypothetical protein
MDNKLYGRVRALFVAVLAISIATLGVAAVVGSSASVWVRDGIVIVIAALLILLAGRAFRGSRAAYLRMRLTATIAPLATLVIIALPNDGFPVWMKVEQAVVGLLLLAAAVMVGRKAVRGAYAKTGEPAR